MGMTDMLPVPCSKEFSTAIRYCELMNQSLKVRS